MCVNACTQTQMCGCTCVCVHPCIYVYLHSGWYYGATKYKYMKIHPQFCPCVKSNIFEETKNDYCKFKNCDTSL